MLTQTDLLKKYQIKIKGHLGQHLLTDPNVARKIVAALHLHPGDAVVEIGPGLGALTWEILKHPVRLIAVEKDARFIEILNQEWRERSEKGEVSSEAKAEWIHQDVLDVDLEGSFRGKQKRSSGFKVVSNLPYYITAPILFKLMDCRDDIERAILMMQKEVARRITAEPGGRDYGRLTLAAGFTASVKTLFDVSPHCFTPKPAVDSTVLEWIYKKNRAASGADRSTDFLELVRVAFCQRRKALAGLLISEGLVRDRETALTVLSHAGLAPDIRGEKLELNQFMKLAEALSVPKSRDV